MTIQEQVILVDENDNQTGISEKIAAHEKALLHRAFSVFIYRKTEKGYEILLQQRHQDKYHCGGLWTNTCCSHPRPGETILVAGMRRLREEMGLQIELKQVGMFKYKALFDNGLTEYELDHVLIGQFAEEKILVNPSEVADYRWSSVTSLLTDLQENSHLYTPWFAEALMMACDEFRLKKIS